MDSKKKQRAVTARHAWALLLVLLIALPAACTAPSSSAPPAPTLPADGAAANPTPTGNSAGEPVAPAGGAFVDGLEVLIMESFPVQARAVISGNLADGCTALQDVAAQRDGSSFLITLDTFRDPDALCTQALVPFETSVTLDVAGLPAGTYEVRAGEVTESFTLDVDNAPQPTPDLAGATVTISAAAARPGEMLTFSGEGFPPQTTVEIGLGLLASEYVIIGTTTTGADGRFSTAVRLPDDAQPQRRYVFVADVNNAKVTAEPLSVLGAQETPAPVLVDEVQVFLIAIEDGGQQGELIGCNDSVVPVRRAIEPTEAPLTAALTLLLGLDADAEGFYNALAASDLTLESAAVIDGEARIALSGQLSLGGTCDDPRVLAQLEQTAAQFSTVESVRITLNGAPLAEQLGGRG